ncbi:MAG TPA: DUF3883 domain-containing protein [Thermococcaceae archaeon]|nr:DUF3883 domain-containing protein [Thermococcaceae archaeon]
MGLTEDVRKGILREVILHNPAFFYTSLTAPGRKPIMPFKHQFQPLYHAMVSRPVRLLIGDEIGLGKTVQALAIARYLELKGEARKILVLVPKILREQWRQEIKRVGGIARVIESGGDVENRLKNTNGYTVVSVDLAKRSPHREKFLSIDWDLIIVDEVHNLTVGTQRYDFLRDLVRLGKKDLNLIFLSATPHKGDPKDYLGRLALLDTTLTEDYLKLDKPLFYKKTRDTLVMRRTKRVVNELEGRDVFQKCDFIAVVVDVSEAEKMFLAELDKTLFEMIKNARENSPEALLAVLVRKRASSSYEAAIKTISKIAESANYPGEGKAERIRKYIENLFGLGYDEIELEEFNEVDDALEKIIEEYSSFLDYRQLTAFQRLLQLGQKIGEKDSKLDMVANIVAYHLKKGEKVIIFTEFKDTLEYVFRRLPVVLRENYGINIDQNDISILYGGMKSSEVETQMRRFEQNGKLLISTDVASEGLNLQVASVLINYEAPWSPIKLEQRVGRIWRLNQTKETTAYTIFLVAETDLYVLDALYRKIMNISEAIGSAPKLGKPIFGKQMYSGDFEKLWKEEAPEEGIGEKQPSEYELVFASIKKELGGYAGAIISTLKILRQNIEKIIPSETAKQVMEELKNILVPEDFDSEVVSRVFMEYFLKVLEKKYIADVKPLLHSIVNKSVVFPGYAVKIGIKGDIEPHYLYFVELVSTKTGKNLHRYPVLIKMEGEKPKYYYGTQFVKYLIDLLSNEPILMGRAKPNLESELLKSKLLTLARDRFYRVREKYRSYDKAFSRQKLKKGSLFLETKVEVREVIRIEGVSEEAFHLAKYVPQDILEIYDLSEKDVEPITDEYKRAIERNFVPLEDILKSEQKAMQLVMQLEKARLEAKYGSNGNWSVEDVSLKEHYDIKVVEPEGERYIEVKGHKPLLLTAELTQAEYGFATAPENADKYWIYIVSNLGKRKPVILKIHKPFGIDTRIYAVTWNGVEIDVTGRLTVDIKQKTRRVISLR